MARVLKDISSSMSALSFAQPETVIALAGIGVAAAVALAKISHDAWKDYKQEQHEKAIDAVNELYEEILENIRTADGADIQGFPPIFQYAKDKNVVDKKSVSSLHYTPRQVRQIGTVLPNVPVELTRYRQAVSDAIKKLKEYYFERDKKNDVTSGVLSYLLNMLETRCLSFVGEDYDIAYLDALAKFVDEYASKDNSENTRTYDHLKLVYSNLLSAKQELEKHKATMSLKNLVDEARNGCFAESDKLLQLLVQMMIPENQWDLIDTVTPAELSNNILRNQFINKEKWKIVLSHLKEVNLPNSIFHVWAVGLAQYYLLSQNPKAILNGAKILRPEQLFTEINWAKTIKKATSPTDLQQQELHKQLELIHKIFEHSPNFINTRLTRVKEHKLLGTEEKMAFVVVKDDAQLIEAAETMAHFAHLIHAIISLEALYEEMSNQIDQLGLDYFDNPHNFHKIFDGFDTLHDIISKDLELLKQKLVDIDVANKNAMHLAKKTAFHELVEKSLKSIGAILLKRVEDVSRYRNQCPKNTETSAQEAISAVQFFQKLYGRLPNMSSAPDSLKAPSVVEATKPEVTVNAIPKKNQSQEELKEALNNLSTRLSTKISLIEHERQQDDQYTAKYNKISSKLRALQIKAIKMLNEPHPTPYRINKAKKTYELTCSLYNTVLDFLERTPEDRTAQATSLINSVHEQLNSVESKAFIDLHKDTFSKFIYETFGFFETKTRRKLSAFEQACKSLATDAPISIKNN